MTTTPLTPCGLNLWKATSRTSAPALSAASTMMRSTAPMSFNTWGSQPWTSASTCRPKAFIASPTPFFPDWCGFSAQKGARARGHATFYQRPPWCQQNQGLRRDITTEPRKSTVNLLGAHSHTRLRAVLRSCQIPLVRVADRAGAGGGQQHARVTRLEHPHSLPGPTGPVRASSPLRHGVAKLAVGDDGRKHLVPGFDIPGRQQIPFREATKPPHHPGHAGRDDGPAEAERPIQKTPV